jgi:peroxiredoxin
MKIVKILLLITLISCHQATPVNPTFEPISIGELAPEFSLQGVDGKTYQLSDFKDKLVVLEWINFDCPFVKKHYNSDNNNMQKLQKKYLNEGVIWLSIISAKKKNPLNLFGSKASSVLLDKSGDVGRLYGVRITPEVYVIGKDGLVAYHGAVDSIASLSVKDIDEAQSYISDTLDALLFSYKIMINSTKPYGCPLKY